MEIIKNKLEKYKIPLKGNEVKISSWQEYAIEVCKEFGLTGNFKAMIFRHAKNNLSYLRGKVENTKEKFGTKDLNKKGNYFISLFRKKNPWL